MLPIIKDRVYAIDIEVAPMSKFDEFSTDTPDEEDEEEEKLEIENPAFLPWTSKIIGIGVCWGEDFDSESVYFPESEVKNVVQFLSQNKLKLAAHNILYDWLHLQYHYGLPLNFTEDSGVHVQSINNSDFVHSYGLKQATARIYNVETQEIEIINHLAEHHKLKRKDYGKYIYLCPVDVIAKYCRFDVHYCWRIIHDSHKWVPSDISSYMKLFIAEVRLTIWQIIHGIKIDIEGIRLQKERLESEIEKIKFNFLNHPELIPYIHIVQKDKFNKDQAKLKKKVLDFDVWSAEEKNRFNIGSKIQLKLLFDAQGLHWEPFSGEFQYPYVNNLTGTKTPNPNSPKLGTKFLHAYGIGGEILSDQGEKKVLLNHIERALEDSKFDGRIHPNINMLGTSSGRISSSGVNIIATPIGEERYGKHLIADEGWRILAKDFSSLEPTILACLSNDPILKYATYEGQGKTPFIKDDVLWIDDIYIVAAYSAPFMRNELMQNLDLSNWVNNPEVEKKKIKHLRSVAKTIVLATNYGASAEKIQQTLSEQLKIIETIKNIQIFQDSYWASISIAHQYKRKLEQEVRRKGFLVNIGGFPLTFYDRPGGRNDGEHKALNRMIQSSASVCMKLLLYYLLPKIEKRDDVVPLVSDWHDCCWLQVKLGKEKEIDLLVESALHDVNSTLNLPLKLRLDCHVGNSFYDCK